MREHWINLITQKINGLTDKELSNTKISLIVNSDEHLVITPKMVSTMGNFDSIPPSITLSCDYKIIFPDMPRKI